VKVVPVIAEIIPRAEILPVVIIPRTEILPVMIIPRIEIPPLRLLNWSCISFGTVKNSFQRMYLALCCLNPRFKR
jgi:hypothetical protein